MSDVMDTLAGLPPGRSLLGNPTLVKRVKNLDCKIVAGTTVFARI